MRGEANIKQYTTYNAHRMPVSPARAAAFDILLRIERESSRLGEVDADIFGHGEGSSFFIGCSPCGFESRTENSDTAPCRAVRLGCSS